MMRLNKIVIIDQRAASQVKGNLSGQSRPNDCKYCGRKHKHGDCPAFGKTCNKCKHKNHFENECRSSQNRSQSRGREQKKSHGDACPKQNYPSVHRSDSSCSDNRDVEHFKFNEIKHVDSTSK